MISLLLWLFQARILLETIFLEGSLKILWSHDQQEPEERAGGVYGLPVSLHRLWRPAEPTGEQNANAGLLLVVTSC